MSRFATTTSRVQISPIAMMCLRADRIATGAACALDRDQAGAGSERRSARVAGTLLYPDAALLAVQKLVTAAHVFADGIGLVVEVAHASLGLEIERHIVLAEAVVVEDRRVLAFGVGCADLGRVTERRHVRAPVVRCDHESVNCGARLDLTQAPLAGAAALSIIRPAKTFRWRR